MLPVEFTLATEDLSPGRRIIVRALERFAGAAQFTRMYQEYLRLGDPDKKLWDFFLERLNLRVNYNADQVELIPAQGPLIAIGNHPYGLIDGAIALHLLHQRRSDVKMFVNELVAQIPEGKDMILPVSFKGDSEATAINHRSLKAGFDHLARGGSLFLFPSGTISFTHKNSSVALDVPWKKSAAALALRTGASVVPFYFHGQNSGLFQRASQISMNFRLPLVFHETMRMQGSEIKVRIGEPRTYSRDDHQPSRLTRQMRRDLYALEHNAG